jgi:hypothetical protein
LQPLDPLWVGVDPDDVETGFDGSHGERKTDVTLADQNKLVRCHTSLL